MLISVCIPHYNRSKYLLAVLDSIRIQDHPQVEVIISDDSSTDNSAQVIPTYIAQNKTSGIRFQYIRQAKNLGYDANLRAAMAAAQGDYLFTLGNDDALPQRNTLSRLVEVLTQLNYPDVSFANFQMYDNPAEVTHRARTTAIVGHGPEVALRTFRSFSFVGGIAIKAAAFHQHNTDKHDGSIYVQMFLAARIIAAGGTLATISESMVAKDVTFTGEDVNSYLDTLAEKNQRLHRETGGLDEVGRVTCDAILPYVPAKSWQRYIRAIYAQLVLFTYPYWLFNYRKHKVYRAAVNLALGCFPLNLVKSRNVTALTYLFLIFLFAATTAAGLLLPVCFLGRMTGVMSRLSKDIRALKRNQSTANIELPAS